MDCSTPGLPVYHQLPEHTQTPQTHVHPVSDAIQPSHPLSSLSPPPSVFPASGSFPVLPIRRPKCWSFSFSISPSNEHSGLISFRMDLFDLLAVQGTLKGLLQQHRSKASILMAVHLLYGPTLTSIHDYWKNHSLDYMDLCWQRDVFTF